MVKLGEEVLFQKAYDEIQPWWQGWHGTLSRGTKTINKEQMSDLYATLSMTASQGANIEQMRRRKGSGGMRKKK